MSAVQSILITSVGSGVGQAVVVAARAVHRPVRVVGMSIPPANAGTSRCDAWMASPLTANTAAFTARLLEVVDVERPSIALPGRDDDVVALARARGRLADRGVRCPGPPAGLATTLRDKFKMARLLAEAGVRACPTAASQQEALGMARDHGFPIVVKPRRGDGSRGVRLAFSDADVRSVMAGDGEFVAQPYLATDDGPSPTQGDAVRQTGELSAQIVIGEGMIIGPFVTRNTLESGVPVTAEVVNASSFGAEARRVATVLERLGVTGPVNVQGRGRDDRTAQVIEVNVRCTGLTGARALLGFNEVGMLLGDACTVTPPLGAIARRSWDYVVDHPGAG